MRASIMITCLVDQFFPQVGVSMAKILDRFGVALDFPPQQTCCGQPAYNAGYVPEAKEAARTMLAAFEESEYVVTPSGSCAGMIIHHYQTLFRDDERELARAKALSQKLYEFSQFMIHVLGVDDVGSRFPFRVTYHPSCHGARLLGLKDEPLQLLAKVKDLELIPLPQQEECCGFGGTFAVKMADISAAMVHQKAACVLKTQAEVLVGTDMACLMNIDGYLKQQGHRVRVMHVAELLAEGAFANA